MLCRFFWVNWFELLLKKQYISVSSFNFVCFGMYLEDLDFTNVTFQRDVCGIKLCLAMYYID